MQEHVHKRALRAPRLDTGGWIRRLDVYPRLGPVGKTGPSTNNVGRTGPVSAFCDAVRRKNDLPLRPHPKESDGFVP